MRRPFLPGPPMTALAATLPTKIRGEVLALQLFIGLILALRLWFQLTGGLLGDEAYYWMWGQHPGWSYFDHPPLHAWLLGLVSFLGWSPFNVRLLTWATLAVVLAIFWAWSKRLAPHDPQLWFWRVAAVYLASPLFSIMTASVYHDHLLVALSLAAIHCFAVFVERVENDLPRATRWLFAGAVLLGLAVLTKYNGVFVGVGIAVTFIARPKLRRLLLTPTPWLAAAIAVGMQAPVVWWNLVESGASLRFHLDDRWGADGAGFHWLNAAGFLPLSALFWSPFLVWPLIKMLRTPPPPGFAAALKPIAVWTFAASTLVFLVTALVLNAYTYWNIVALLAVTPLLVVHTTGWLRLLHYGYGLLWVVAMLINTTVVPLATLVDKRDLGWALNYDFDIVAERMRKQAADRPDVLMAATLYSTTAQLGFALGTTDVVKLSPEHSQWDYWQEGRDFTGRSALILANEPDNSRTIKFLRAHFDTLEVVDSFKIRRIGKPIYTWRIFLGENWKP